MPLALKERGYATASFVEATDIVQPTLLCCRDSQYSAYCGEVQSHVYI